MEYYILDTRTIVGNCAMFWRGNSTGYTTDLKDAGRYSEEFAAQRNRPTDVGIPCDEVEKLAVLYVRRDTEEFAALQNRFRRFYECGKCGGDGYIDQTFCSDQAPWKCQNCGGKGYLPVSSQLDGGPNVQAS